MSFIILRSTTCWFIRLVQILPSYVTIFNKYGNYYMTIKSNMKVIVKFTIFIYFQNSLSFDQKTKNYEDVWIKKVWSWICIDNYSYHHHTVV